jgi:hypothetical protein
MKPQRNNSGVLFKNDRKESERHPHYTGSINIDGIERRLSAWIKDRPNGGKFMSLSVTAVAPADAPTARRPIATPADDMADEVMF